LQPPFLFKAKGVGWLAQIAGDMVQEKEETYQETSVAAVLDAAATPFTW
jgi:hypothetical protein